MSCSLAKHQETPSSIMAGRMFKVSHCTFTPSTADRRRAIDLDSRLFRSAPSILTRITATSE
jgi:hypothetical protein